MIRSVAKTLIYVLSIIIAFSVSAQESKQGNIVEYFGKEKVEEIHEGIVKHVFKEGLILRIRSFGFNSSSTPQNAVYAKFLLEDPKEINERDAFIEDASGNPLKWEKIEVDEKNENLGQANIQDTPCGNVPKAIDQQSKLLMPGRLLR